jgi:hypothetical protein
MFCRPERAGGLHHLIDRAGTWIEELLAEPDGGIVDDGGRLKTGGVAVAATGSQFFMRPLDQGTFVRGDPGGLWFTG